MTDTTNSECNTYQVPAPLSEEKLKITNVYIPTEEQKAYQAWLETLVDKTPMGRPVTRREQLRAGPVPAMMLGWSEVAFQAGYLAGKIKSD